MDADNQEVQICGREAQVFAMNLMMELRQVSMIKLKKQFEEKEIHIADVFIILSIHMLVF